MATAMCRTADGENNAAAAQLVETRIQSISSNVVLGGLSALRSRYMQPARNIPAIADPAKNGVVALPHVATVANTTVPKA